ncbi:MAG: acetate--CoA ligase family protein, partial [Synergistaceae bacterium]|nr:acetate--CoA ligase family protein [Synergistaceae bacterium]
AGLRNPIDLTVEGTGEHYGKAAATALLENDSSVILYIGTPYLKAMPTAEGIVSAAKETGKPIAAVMQVGPDIDESLACLRREGIPCFPSGERAVSVISAMAAYEDIKSRAAEPCFETAEPSGHAFISGENRLLEPDAMALLRENGISVPEFRFAKNEEEAAEAAEKIGFPVVVKVVSPEIVHKSDRGGVALGVGDADGVREAFRRMRGICDGGDFRGVVVYPMLKAGKEAIIGLTNDPTFGPVVAFGMGGVYTEVLRDITFRVAPVSEIQALGMIREIKMYPLLRGTRGEAPIDESALAGTIAAFSRLSSRYPDISEADLNPVFLYENGVVAADARILGKQK